MSIYIYMYIYIHIYMRVHMYVIHAHIHMIVREKKQDARYKRNATCPRLSSVTHTYMQYEPPGLPSDYDHLTITMTGERVLGALTLFFNTNSASPPHS